MRRIALIGCGKAKSATTKPARELYTGTLFRSALTYAEARVARVYVLSALHGLVPLERDLAPYDDTMTGKSVRDADAWAGRVCSALVHAERPSPADPITVELLAGEAYVSPLRAALVSWCVAWPGRAGAIVVEMPLRGLGMGQRMAWFAGRRAA